MKGKRGILMKNVLGIIIAVLGLSLIIYGAYRVYTANVNLEEKSARNIIDSIEGKIDNLEEGQSSSITIRGLKGWSLVGWNKDDSFRPEQCFLDSCLCICDTGVASEAREGEGFRPHQLTTENDLRKVLSSKCDDRGFCRLFEGENVEVFMKGDCYRFEGFIVINWAVKVGEEEIPVIDLGPNLFEIDVEKDSSLVSLRTTTNRSYLGCEGFNENE